MGGVIIITFDLKGTKDSELKNLNKSFHLVE